MGLLDRVRSEELAQLLADGHRTQEAARWEHHQEERRISVVTRRLEVVSAEIGEPLQDVSGKPVGMPRYFAIGDVVIMVQQFVLGADKPDPGRPDLLTFDYCAYLVALGPEKALGHYRIGSLKFLDYSGIAEAIKRAPAGCTLDAGAVMLYLPRA